MKFLIFCLGSVFLVPGLVFAKTVATYSYSKSPSKVIKTLTLEELQREYTNTKSSTFNAPGPKAFFEEFLRFKLGVEVALHEPSLVKNPKIVDSMASPALRASFEREIYKALAELKLRKQMKALDKRSSKLSDKALRNLYRANPEFNYFYISINHPVGPTKAQIREAESRAQKVFAQVKNSKKEFTELVALNSDEKVLGVLPVSRSRTIILPNVYRKLKTMRPGQISAPIRVANGYQIVKLNEKTPFDRANKVLIKADYFNEQRAKIFNNYFNSLKRQFSVKVVNRKLIDSLK